MTSQDQNNNKKEMRVMWIFTAVIVVAILGMMGSYVLTHPDWKHEYTSVKAGEVSN